MAEIFDQNIGMVTAYAYAVSKGYTGTEEEFAEALANVGTSIDEIEDAINEFNNETVPAAIQSIISEGTTQKNAVNSAGTAQVTAVNSAGEEKLNAITQTGTTILNGITSEGENQVEAVQAEGTTQVGNINTAGTTQVENVNTAGTTQVAAVESAGETQTGNVNTAGETQVSNIQTKGEETIESIPDDYSKMGYLQELLHDEVADTVQEYTFSGGSVSQIKHKRGNIDIRTDVFTYGDGTITEMRTLNSGESVMIETNLATLETAVTYTE